LVALSTILPTGVAHRCSCSQSMVMLVTSYLVTWSSTGLPWTATPRPSPHTSPAAQAAEPVATTSGPGGTTILVFLFAFVVGGYLLSLRLHPFSKCPRCKGKGIHRGGIFNYSTRACTKCKGRAIQPRLGRRILPYSNK